MKICPTPKNERVLTNSVRNPRSSRDYWGLHASYAYQIDTTRTVLTTTVVQIIKFEFPLEFFVIFLNIPKAQFFKILSISFSGLYVGKLD